MSETSWSWPVHLEGLRVVDVDGRAMGRVARNDAPTERFVIELSARAERRWDAPDRFVPVAWRDVVNADDHEVTLGEEGRFLVHPEQRVVVHDDDSRSAFDP